MFVYHSSEMVSSQFDQNKPYNRQPHSEVNMTSEPVEFRDARAVRALMHSHHIDFNRAVAAHAFMELDHGSPKIASEPIAIHESISNSEQVEEDLSALAEGRESTASRKRKAASLSEASEGEDEAHTSEDDPPNMLDAKDYFRVHQPRPLTIRVPSGPNGESRLVHYHSQVDWNSKIAVKVLNRWRLQAQRRARIKWGGELKRRAMVKYTDTETKWLRDELGKDPRMSTATIKATVFPRFREKFSETTRGDHGLMMLIAKNASIRQARGLQVTPEAIRDSHDGNDQSSTESGKDEDGSKEMESLEGEEMDGETTSSREEEEM